MHSIKNQTYVITEEVIRNQITSIDSFMVFSRMPCWKIEDYQHPKFRENAKKRKTLQKFEVTHNPQIH